MRMKWRFCGGGTISEALLSLDSSDAGDVMAYLLHKMKLRNRDLIKTFEEVIYEHGTREASANKERTI